MNRWSIFSIVGLLAFSAALVCAQDSGSRLFSSDLVAWSGMQQPTAPEDNKARQQPTPEPAPDTQPSQQPTPQPKADQSSTSSTGAQAPTAATYTGTVNKGAEGYTLKVSETTAYKLDNQQQVQQFEGQRVRVTGTLDSSINLIHVDKIEPLS